MDPVNRHSRLPLCVQNALLFVIPVILAVITVVILRMYIGSLSPEEHVTLGDRINSVAEWFARAWRWNEYLKGNRYAPY